MRYIDVLWAHTDKSYPVRMISEIGADNFETRKIEIWADGRIGYASAAGPSHNRCLLGDQPTPSVDEINQSSEFEAKEIASSEFEALWHRYAHSEQQHAADNLADGVRRYE